MKYIFFFLVSVSSGAYHIILKVGVLMDLLQSLGDVAKLLHLHVHCAFRHVLLMKGLSELLPGDVGGVRVSVTEAVPPSMCCSSELVDSDTYTLLIKASGQVHLLLDLA